MHVTGLFRGFGILPLLALTIMQGVCRADDSRDILKDAILVHAERGRPIILGSDGEIASKDKFTPPIEITYVVMTNSTNIRFSYAAEHIIFNWEVDRSDLRIWGGPASGKHKPSAGKVPANEFVTIVQTVLPNEMRLSVNGIERATWKADFSKVDNQIRIWGGKGRTISVKEITVRHPK
jgi:hypothetical protein